MSEFKLGEFVLVTTPARDALAGLRKAYLARASQFCGAFGAEFGSVVDLDALFVRYAAVLKQACDQTVVAVAQDIAQERIYHLDAAALREELETRANTFREDFDRVYERYHAITVEGADREALRAAEAGNGPSILGGGFGVKGAVEGIAIATAANAAIGIVQDAAGAVAKAAANGADRQRKQELLKAPETRAALIGLLRGFIVEGHRLVADIVNRESAAPRYEVITPEDSRRASALSQNVQAGRVPGIDIAPVLLQSLQLDPFSELPWRLWFEHLGDTDGGLARAAEALGGADVGQLKRELLERKRAALTWSTPEQCRSSGADLEKTALLLGLPFEHERNEINNRAEALDRQRLTFCGTVYATLEARNAAEDAASRTIDGVLYGSHAEADAARTVIAEERARTFRGVVYSTPKNVETAQKRYYRSRSLFLWFAIIMGGFPGALVTLAPGFRPLARIVALAWMAFRLLLLLPLPPADFASRIVSSTIGTLAALGLMKVEVWIRRTWSPPKLDVVGQYSSSGAVFNQSNLSNIDDLWK